MSYQTSSKRLPLFWFLIGARKLLCFSAQSEGRTAATVWNWSGKTLSLGALLVVLYFSSCHIFRPVWTFSRPHYLPLGLRGWTWFICQLSFTTAFKLLYSNLRWYLLPLIEETLWLPFVHNRQHNGGHCVLLTAQHSHQNPRKLQIGSFASQKWIRPCLHRSAQFLNRSIF